MVLGAALRNFSTSMVFEKRFIESLVGGVLHLKIFISHDPEDETRARVLAAQLRAVGNEVIVAADVRPKDAASKPPELCTKEELKKVNDAICSCDLTLVIE